MNLFATFLLVIQQDPTRTEGIQSFTRHSMLLQINSKFMLYAAFASFQLSQHLLSPCLYGQKDHCNERCQKESTAHENWSFGTCIWDIRCNNGSTEPTDPVQETGDSYSGSPVRCWEYLRCVSIKDAIHDVLEECFDGRKSQLIFRV
jgi:hypothetical protein